jgi:DNA topoisomerase-6 subunit B
MREAPPISRARVLLGIPTVPGENVTDIAEKLARQQKEISIAEFFEKNKQILGFDSQIRALITAVKEGVDNSLDACEEARILPDILVEITEEAEKGTFKIVIEDNGPGIVQRQIPNVFGRLLYGSRFHAIRQSRGQQGIGISAVVMYSQLTTGKPAFILSKIASEEVAHYVKLVLDIKKNRPDVIEEDFRMWESKQHGTRIEVYLKGRYVVGKQSVLEYLRATAIVNPHVNITFKDPNGGVISLPRVSDELPKETVESKPHPMGIELGQLMAMAKASEHRKLSAFLCEEFSRVSPRVAKEICEAAGVPEERNPKRMPLEEGAAVLKAIGTVKIMAPKTDCLTPIGETLIRKGLRNVLEGLKPGYYAPPVTRDPSVFSGHPFQVEVGMVYGGQLPKEEQVEILRYANRVPLLYQQGADVITKAIMEVDWRRYGLEQRGGKGIPFGPAIILVHVASTSVPFTSEAKEAVSNLDQIREEIIRALRLCARNLKTHLSKKARRSKTREKFDIVQLLLPEIAKKAASIVGKPVPDLGKTVTGIMNVIWIDQKLEFAKGRHRAEVRIHNYMATGQKFRIHTILPGNALDRKKLTPEPDVTNGDKLTWEMKRIPSTEIVTIAFELTGLDQDEYQEVELFVSGIDHTHVIGAEPLPGDWDLDGTGQYSLFQFGEAAEDVEEEEESDDDDEDNGVDYDEGSEVISDEE